MALMGHVQFFFSFLNKKSRLFFSFLLFSLFCFILFIVLQDNYSKNILKTK